MSDHPAAVQSQYGAKDGRTWHDYTVRPGDSLVAIAARHQTTVASLVTKNKIADPRHLTTGRTIKVPGAAPKRSTAPATRPTQPKRAAAKASAPTRWTRTHLVQPGETAYSISGKFNTTPRALLKANRISDPRLLKHGTKIRVPAKPKPASKPTAKSPTSTKNNTFLGRTYPNEVVAQAARNREALRHAEVPSRSATRALVTRTAQQYGVNPKLALAIAWQESGWNQRAVSVANAVGVMQVMPRTGPWCASLVGRDLDLMDPTDNVTAGVVFLRWLTEHAGSSEDAIAGYYQGLGSVEKNGMFPDTKDYVANVKAHMKRF